MTVPFLMKISRGRLRQSLFSRLYSQKSHLPKYTDLFQRAKLYLTEDMRVNLIQTDFMHANIAFTGEYEPKFSKYLAEIATEGGTFVDIGANLGFFSLIWLDKNPQNQAICVEASPQVFKLLSQNVALNAVSDRVTLHDCAVGELEGTLIFDTGPPGITGWGGFSNEANATTVEVKVRPLDELLGPNSDVRMLKVDVEGAEAWVFAGARQMLQRGQIQTIWFEENKVRQKQLGIDEGAAPAFLKSMGYHVSPASDPRSGLVDWLAERQ